MVFFCCSFLSSCNKIKSTITGRQNITGTWQATFNGSNYAWTGIWPDDFLATSSNHGEASYDPNTTGIGEITLTNGNSNHIELYFNFGGPVSTGTYLLNSNVDKYLSVSASGGCGVLWSTSMAGPVVPYDCFVTVNITSVDDELVKGNFSGKVIELCNNTYNVAQVSGSFEAVVI